MRLIDADLLMENYDLKSATKYGNKTAQQQEHSYGTLMMYEIADMIEDAPTAYDVEAVVKQIEDASVELYGFAKVVGLDKVIELVRNGGVK